MNRTYSLYLFNTGRDCQSVFSFRKKAVCHLVTRDTIFKKQVCQIQLMMKASTAINGLKYISSIIQGAE